MSKIYSPKIVQDGLVMCLDASQNKSYPTTDLSVKSGIALWLDASDDTTFSYSSGTSVSQWRDKSGNNFHATQALSANQPSRSTTQNSRKTVNFDGTNDTVTIPNFSCNSEMSIFVVSNCGTTLLIEHSTDTNSNQGFYFYGGGGGMIYITRTGGSLISNTNWLSGGYSVASAVNSTGLDLLAYKNGTQQSLTNDGRNSFTNSYVTNTLYIGSRGANSLWSSGPIAEIIIYNRKVSDTERKQVHTYLGQKWGVSNTDRSIIDLSGNNNHGLLGNGTVANMPDYDYYNKGTLSFNQTSNDTVLTSLPITATPALSNFTYEVWTKLNRFPPIVSPPNGYGVTYRAGFLFGASYYGGAGLLWYGNANGNAFNLYAFIRGTDAYRNTNAYSFNTDQYYHCVMVNNYGANKLQLFINGTLYSEVATATAQYDASNASAAGNIGISKAQIDGGGTANYSYYDGVVPVARIYNKALSATEVLQNYEVQKSKFANTIVQQGLVLNLDAGNPYSYAGAGTTWIDVSGNNYSGSLTNGPVYSSTNDGVFIFDGSNDYVDLTSVTFSISGNASRSMFAWVKTTYNGNQAFIATGTPAGSQAFILVKYGSYIGVMGYNNDFYPSSGKAVADGMWHYVGATFDGTNIRTYVDGVLDNTSGIITYTTTGQNNYVGRSNHAGNENFINGSMGNAQVYNRTLSAAEVLQNYNATKGRFGL